MSFFCKICLKVYPCGPLWEFVSLALRVCFMAAMACQLPS